MATCRKMTKAERIRSAEQAAGGSLTPEARKTLELTIGATPAPYVCSGAGVGSLAGRRPRKKRR